MCLCMGYYVNFFGRKNSENEFSSDNVLISLKSSKTFQTRQHFSDKCNKSITT